MSEPVDNDALARLMATLNSAIIEYDQTVSADEREAQRTCDCELCQGMRLLRLAVTKYQVMAAKDAERWE